MGIAAYNRGSRAISAYIDQQRREAMRVQTEPEPLRMWTPPKGWHKAACAARDEAGDYARRVADNERRRQYGLPEYLP